MPAEGQAQLIPEQIVMDCVVLGTSPAGVWALRKIHEESYGRLKLGLIGKFSEAPVWIPAPVARHYGLTIETSLAPKVCFPGSNFTWSEKELQKRLGEAVDFSSFRKELLLGKLVSTDRLLVLLRRYPEWLAIAKGFAKLLGLSDEATIPQLLSQSLLYFEMGTWIPRSDLPPTLTHVPVDLGKSAPISVTRNTQKRIEFTLPDGTSIATKSILLNGSRLELSPWVDVLEKGKFSTGHDDSFSEGTSLFPLVLKARANAIPRSLESFFLLMDCDEIPDPETEIWPVEVRHSDEEVTLTLWVEAPRPVSLETVEERMRSAVRRLYLYFPFLSEQVISFEPSLNSTDCGDEEAREAQWKYIESKSSERYRYCLTDYRTRTSAVYNASAMVASHMGFPLGSLEIASRLVTPLVRSFKLPKMERVAKEPPGISPT